MDLSLQFPTLYVVRLVGASVMVLSLCRCDAEFGEAADLKSQEWVRTISSTAGATLTGLAIDNDGVVYASGFHEGVLQFETGTNHPGVGDEHTFIGSYHRNGDPGWSATYGVDEEFITGLDLETDPNGQPVIVGSTSSDVRFGPLQVTDTDTDQRVFVVSHSQAGNAQMLHHYEEGDRNAQARGIGISENGNFALTGNYSDIPDFGGGPLPQSTTDAAFLTVFSAGMNLVWSQGIVTDAGSSFGLAAQVQDTGQSVFVGRFSGTSTIGPVTLPHVGGNDGYVMRFDPNGGHLWSWILAGPGSETVEDVAVFANGDYVVVGGASSGAQTEAGVVPNQGDVDIFVARLSADGRLLWIRTFGGIGEDEAHAVVVTDEQTILVAGEFRGTATILGASVQAEGSGDDGFFGALDGDGNPLWVKTVATGEGASDVDRMAFDAQANEIIVGGNFVGVAQFGPFTRDAENERTGFVYRTQIP